MIRWWATLLERGYLRWLLVALDVLLINLAFLVAWWVRYELQIGGLVEFRNYVSYARYLPTVGVLTGLMLLNLHMEGLYRVRRGATWFDEVYGIVNATTTSVLLLVVFFFFYQYFAFSRLVYAYVAALLVIFLALARLVLRGWLGWLRQRGVGVTRVLIVGGSEAGRTLMRHIVAQPELGYQVVGFVDDDPERLQDIGRILALGTIESIPRLVRTHGIDKVIVTLPWRYHDKILPILEQCNQQQVEFRIVPDLFQLSLTRVTFDEIRGMPLISLREPALRGMNLMLKRAMDVLLAGVGLVVLGPFALLVALAIRLDSPGPIIFRQMRVGRGGKPFEVYKFRSMRAGADQEVAQLASANEAVGPMFKIRKDPRVTRVGRFIRKSSLDEYPQLWNILRGDMSLIGPRPALPSEVAQYEEWHRKRLEAAPGLTGLWQVSGRSDVTFDEMMLLDIYYTEQWSPMLDAMILLKTIPTVLFQRGAY